MARVDGDSPAFPHVAGSLEPGMSLRTWLAGQAMAGIISKLPPMQNYDGGPCKVAKVDCDEVVSQVAAGSVFYADALLAALNK